MNVKKIVISSALVLSTVTSWAQFKGAGNPQGGAQQMPQNKTQGCGLNENFFTPEMVMQNQLSLNLSDEQKSSIKKFMKESVLAFTDLQWQQSIKQEAMVLILKQEKIDEAKAISQLEKLLVIENEIKKLHLSSLIKVKNLLSADQQATLASLKGTSCPAGMGGSMQGERRRERNQGGKQTQGNLPPPGQE
jgi:Spy/CpxP family protein refolding chaperone